MEERNKKTELLVGLFLSVGLLLLGLLVLQFGSVRELFKDTYSLTVTFPDGTGIKDSTPVILGGSRIGKVSGKPSLNATFNGVIIPLEVYETVKIPSDAQFSIGTAGLLGDSFIEIKTSGAAPTSFILPDSQIVGKPPSGLSGLQDTATQLATKVDLALEDIRGAVGDLRVSIKNINEGALSEKSMADIKGSLAHLNSVMTRFDEKTFGDETSANIKEAVASFKNAAKALEDTTKKLDPAVAKIDGVVVKADSVMVSANSAMKSLDSTAASIGKVATDLRKGNGLLPALIYDPALKNEFASLITNLRQRGVLFYKDKSPPQEVPVAPRKR